MTVEIRGEVPHPGRYALEAGSTLSSLILLAGGYADDAWLPGAALLRWSEKARQASELEGIARRLESASRSAGTGEEGSDPISEMAASLRILSPSGRVPVRLSHLRLMINGPEDLPLADGDSLRIPPPPTTIRVLGAVRAPGEYPASAGAGLSEVSAAAGGLLPGADRKGAILLKADGTAWPLSEGWIVWNRDAGRWELSLFRRDRPRIEAGDTIFVPRDPGRGKWPGGIEDYRRTIQRILELVGPEGWR